MSDEDHGRENSAADRAELNDPFVEISRKVRSAAFIEIHTDAGVIGIGETYTGYHAPEVVPAIVDYFKLILVGLDESEIDPRELWRRMYYCANFWCRVGVGVNVLAGIEGALWDLRGKLDNKPVHALLGPPAHDKLLCYATGCASPYPWSQFRRKLDLYREAGFGAMKVATGWLDYEDGSSFWSNDPQAWIDLETEKLSITQEHASDEFVMCLDGHMSNDGSRYGAACTFLKVRFQSQMRAFWPLPWIGACLRSARFREKPRSSAYSHLQRGGRRMGRGYRHARVSIARTLQPLLLRGAPSLPRY